MAPRGILGAGLLLAGAVLVGRAVSLAKELYVAAAYGAGPATDAYALLMLIPTAGMALLVNGPRIAFLARYPRRLHADPAEAPGFAGTFLLLLIVLATVFAAIPSFATAPLLSAVASTGAEAGAAAVLLSAWLLVPMAAAAGLTALLQAGRRFHGPQLLTVIPSLCIVAAVTATGSAGGAVTLLGGLFVGTVAQCAVLVVMSRAGSTRPDFRGGFRPRAAAEILRFAAPVVVIDLIALGSVAMGRVMASTLDAGAVAVLAWSVLIKDAIAGVLISSFTTVLTPHFSAQAARGALDELRRSCESLLRYGALILMPVSVLLSVCGWGLLRELDVGRLDATAARSLAACVAAFSPGLYAEFAAASLAQALLMLGRLGPLVLLGLFANLLPQLALNLLLIGPFGAPGLAGASAAVAWFHLACAYLVYRKLAGAERERETFKLLSAAAAGALAMVAVQIVVVAASDAAFPQSRAGRIAGVAAAGVAGTFAYVAIVGAFARGEETRAIVATLRRIGPAALPDSRR